MDGSLVPLAEVGRRYTCTCRGQRPFDPARRLGASDGMKRAPSTAVVRVKQARRPTVADVIDRVLDKGIVVEYHVNRVSLSGIDLPVAVDARVVVVSLDTYLDYADP
jgi:Gas vesicle protein